MTIKQFIEKAKQGGWDESSSWFDGVVIPQKMLLDTDAWRAVGKVERWGVGWYDRNIPGWHYEMLVMIDALAEGKSIEDYIKTL